MTLRPIPSSLAITALAALLINGCGGAAGTVAGAGSSGQIGSLTFAIVGAAQNPVTSSAAFGANVTAIAGALVDRLTLNAQGPNTLSDTKIVFNSFQSGNSEIYSMNSDGSNQVPLTTNSALDYEPEWSPDRSKITFTSARDGNNEIYVMNADGTNQTRLTNSASSDNSPAWSPDGTKIAFYSSRNGNDEIYVMNADGTAQTRLTNNPSSDLQPCFSPDGRYILFASLRDGNYELYVMSSAGTNQIRLTNNASSDYAPAYSPDGSKIVFTSFRDGNAEIYSMNADGTNQFRLTNNFSTDDEPGWSPDGTKICFMAFRDGSADVYTMSSGGSNPKALQNLQLSSEGSPSWSTYFPRTPKTLVGPSGTLGTAAAGFLFGQEGDLIKSVVTFDTTTIGTRSASRVASQTALETQGSNLIFSITTSAGLANISYVPISDTGIPGAAVNPTIPTGSTAALVSFNATTGLVSSILPYAANRSNAKPTVQGDTLTYTGSFTAVYNAKGENVATNGASSITLNAKTGELVSYIKN